MGAFSPPKELTERSGDECSSNNYYRTRQAYTDYQPVSDNKEGFVVEEEESSEGLHHFRSPKATPGFVSPGVDNEQSSSQKRASVDSKRSKQVFDWTRPSQVYIPQQTDSDDLNCGEEEDGTPSMDQARNDCIQVMLKDQSQQNSSAPILSENPYQSQPATAQKHSSLEHLSPASKVSTHTPQQVQIPNTTKNHQSPQQSSEKSPLGFSVGGVNQERSSSQSYSQMETMKSMDRSQMIGDEYCLLKDLGEGTFGNVKLGKHLSSGQLVAVKILEKKRITDQADVERVIREIKILKSIRHPHIIKLYEIIETKARIFLIMEYACGGELFDYIVRKDRLTEKEACRFYNQVVSGIEFLHGKGIAHRDLKPENLLLDKQKNLKIVDFGLSNTYKPGETLKTACGSPCYAAPEMIAGKRYNGIEVDIWSSGVTLYAMLCGFLPFEDPDTALLYKKILKGDFELPDFLTNRSIKFLKEILSTDPTKRLNLKQIKQHAWLTQFDLMKSTTTSGLLERTENTRVGLSMTAAVDENKNNVYNTQVYGVKGNSSLIDQPARKEAGITTTQVTNKTSSAAQQQKALAVANTTKQSYLIQQSNTNQTVSSLGNSAHSKPTIGASHQKSVSETNQAATGSDSAAIGVNSATNSRPSTSLKKNAPTTGKVASKSHNQGKRLKQQTAMSAVVTSPRQQRKIVGVGPQSLKRSAAGAEDVPLHKSERKQKSNLNLKEKLKTLKRGNIDPILQQKHQPAPSTQKVRTQKVPTALNLLNNTMPMPKLKIDLASPSTGGSSDVVNTGTKTVTGSIIHSIPQPQIQTTLRNKESTFKNNLARVAKNSAVAVSLQINQEGRPYPHHHGGSSKKSVSLRKQLLIHQEATQKLVTHARSVIGAAAGTTHSSLSNKRQKSPRGISYSSSHTVQISNSASKSQHAKMNQANSQQTFSFLNSKAVARNSKQLQSSSNFTSVHPYTIMAMPQHSSQQHLKESNTLTSMATTNKKSSTRQSMIGADPSLNKISKAFIKSHQSLQVSLGQSSNQMIQTNLLSRQQGTSKMLSHQTGSVESQLRNVKIALSKKAPNFMADYSNALYGKVMREQRHVQSLEILQKRNKSADRIQPMRTYSCAVAPEWTTTEPVAKIIAILEALLTAMGAQFVKRKTPYLYSIKLPRPQHGQTRSSKVEIELMSLQSCPFVTVLRINQKLKQKSEPKKADATEREASFAQLSCFYQQLRQVLKLDG